MNGALKLVFSAVMSVGLAHGAHASVVVPTFTVNPTTITAGGTISGTFTLAAMPDGGHDYASFIYGSATVYSGAGSSQTFSFGGDTATQTFSYTLLYSTSGTYTPSVSFNAWLLETYVRDGGEAGAIYITDNVFSYGSSNAPSSVTVNAPVAATPLPAALPLFATGLAGMGVLGWRKRRKVAAA